MFWASPTVTDAHGRSTFYFLLSTFYFLFALSLPMSSQNCGFTVVEATIPEMQRAMQEKRVTSRDLVLESLDRIEKYESTLNAAITVNPRALAGGGRARSRARGRSRARTASRHPNRRQRQHSDDRYADHRRGAGFQRVPPALRSDAGEKPARCRSDHHRQDEHDRAGQLGGVRHAEQLQRTGRLWHEPVRSAARSAAGQSTAGRRSILVVRVPEPEPRQASGRRMWARKPQDRSCHRRTRTCWRPSSRP